MKRRERCEKADSRTNLRLDIPYSLQWVKLLEICAILKILLFIWLTNCLGLKPLVPTHIMPEWHFLNACAILDGALYFAYFLFCKAQEGG